MSFLDRLLGRTAPDPVAPPEPTVIEEAPAPRAHVAAPRREFVNVEVLDASALRMNMWAMYGGQLAIVTGCKADGQVEITLQKEDGTTLVELDDKDKAINAVRLVEPGSLRHARIEEIPAWRFQGEDHIRSFGYISQSEVAQ